MSWRNLDLTFRQSFKYPSGVINWFPGHMVKAMRHVQMSLKEADLVIEVHDARVPFTGRNPKFQTHVIGSLPHMLVLNKKDLIPKSQYDAISNALKKKDPYLKDVTFTNCKEIHCKGLKKIIPKAVELIKSSERYNRSGNSSSNILVVGIPNVGKSSIINALRNINLRVAGKATHVGAIPGVTKSVLTKIRVNNDPSTYLIDTPGIIMPNIRNRDAGMKLTLCATIKEDAVGLETLADYLLYTLNKASEFSYVDLMNLERPYDDIREFIIHSAKSLGIVRKGKNLDTGSLQIYPDTPVICTRFLKFYREGKLCTLNLDADVLKS